MNMNPATTLKWGAVVFAVFWTGAMLWWTGATGPVEILILAFCGVLGSYGWYHAMCFAFRYARLLPPLERDGTTEARRGKLYRCMVWAGGMAITGILTMWLLDLVDPLIPVGDWQLLAKQLFVVSVWPILMWSLRPMIQRHLPPSAR